ncbi:class I SAM-dependent methyltransferase [Pseudoroseicyclus tamaricis]|uniref:Class I SAM-dependent methyltransferase n=1 Tax=Pseudoroseicyclus tamaricis TaxID=2705421 RepID=A0A6B2JXU6_9RHOB|nr:class I SAM-dependent methyltransferase [Pseudoroseicyclus tamaricis]NDV02675.1 class I SAM-dependent methyltransferase [Pseudoroseicyclus tamaricis]
MSDPEAWHRKLDAIAGRAGSEGRLLEFGAGTGSSALKLAPRVGEILATDISPKMIEIARNKAAEAGATNVTFQQGTIFDVTKGPFDGIVGLNVLHLMPDWREALAHARGLLTEGGFLAISTAGIGDHPSVARLGIRAGSALGLFPPIAVFTIADLRAGLATAGFRLIEEWQPKTGAAWFQLAEVA